MVTPDQTVGLRITGLSIEFSGVSTLHDLDLTARPGRLLGLVGESGAGKSLTLAAVLGLLPRNARVRGRLDLDGLHGMSIDLADREALARQVRGRRVALVPQSPATWLTPVRTLGSQLREAARAVRGRDGTSARSRSVGTPSLRGVPQRGTATIGPVEHGTSARSRSVGTPSLRGVPQRGTATIGPVEQSAHDAVLTAVQNAHLPAELLDRYPHEVSGGQLQRAALALALVGGANVVLADEPTTGLDPELAGLAIGQLRAQADRGHTVVMVTHDLAAVERVADDVVILYGGRVVEACEASRFFSAPAHPYSAALLDALPSRAFRPIDDALASQLRGGLKGMASGRPS